MHLAGLFIVDIVVKGKILLVVRGGGVSSIMFLKNLLVGIKIVVPVEIEPKFQNWFLKLRGVFCGMDIANFLWESDATIPLTSVFQT